MYKHPLTPCGYHTLSTIHSPHRLEVKVKKNNSLCINLVIININNNKVSALHHKTLKHMPHSTLMGQRRWSGEHTRHRTSRRHCRNLTRHKRPNVTRTVVGQCQSNVYKILRNRSMLTLYLLYVKKIRLSSTYGPFQIGVTHQRPGEVT